MDVGIAGDAVTTETRVRSRPARRGKAKVISIDGSTHNNAGRAMPDVVEDLERLLDRAKRGEILRIAYVTVTGASNMPSVSTGWSAGCADCNLMIAGAGSLQYRMIKAVDERG